MKTKQQAVTDIAALLAQYFEQNFNLFGELLSLDSYQDFAAETSGAYGCEHDLEQFLGATVGLAGEVGELLNLVKKARWHQHVVTQDEFAEELGDVLWYVAECATAFDLQLSDVALQNINKLAARYGGKFSAERSQNRQTRLPGQCIWRLHDEATGTYEASCGEWYSLIDGTPGENNFRYCMYCGREIREP